MNIPLQAKQEVAAQVAAMLSSKQLPVVAQDFSRPWGGFFVIDEAAAAAFIAAFFPAYSLADFAGYEKLSPKILVVAPEKRLSWQYHHRRAELWRLIDGTAGVMKSETDDETQVQTLALGEEVTLACGERHRLVGLHDYGIIAEIWKHTDPEKPSDENDIVRLQDDFGR